MMQHLREIEVVPENVVRGESIEIPRRDDFGWAWLLWEGRAFLGRVTLWGLIVSVAIAALIPNRYQSSVRLMPPDQGSSGLAMLAAMASKNGMGPVMGGALGGIAGDLLGMKSSGAIFIDIVRSRSVEDRLIDRFDLRKVYRHKYYEETRKELTDSTQATEDRKSGTITISVTDKDRARAQQIAQAYVDELDRMVALVSTSSARRERIFLEQRLQQVKTDLDAAAQQFAEYASKNTVIELNSQTRAMVESASVLQGQLIAAQSELEGLEQIYTPNNIRVRALKARVQELNDQLHKMGGKDASLTTNASEGGSDSDQLYPSIRELPLLGVRWAELYREAKIRETVFELLTQECELAKIEEAKEIPTVKLLDPPGWPEKKSSPHRISIVALGSIFAFGLGAIWLLGTAAWQQMDPQDSRKQLGQEMGTHIAAAASRWSGRFPVIARTRAWWERRKSGLRA